MKRLFLILLGALVACASPSALEKGGLVPLRLDEAALSTAYAPRRIALLVGISEFQDPAVAQPALLGEGRARTSPRP